MHVLHVLNLTCKRLRYVIRCSLNQAYLCKII